MLRGRSLWTFVHGTNPEADIVTTGVITVAEAMLAGTGAGKREKSHILRRINALLPLCRQVRFGTRRQGVDARIGVPRRRSLVAPTRNASQRVVSMSRSACYSLIFKIFRC